MRRAALVLVAFVGSCGGPNRADSFRGDGVRLAPRASPFAVLAQEVDPGDQPAFWPIVPADLRAPFEADPPKDADRLRVARELLGTWTAELDASPADLEAKFAAALRGVFLAESIARGPAGDDAVVAMGLLHHVFAALDQDAYVAWVKAAPKVPIDRKVHELLAAAAPNMRRYLAAHVLRAGKPGEAVAPVLKDLADRTHDDAKKARDLYVLYIGQRGEAATPDDWVAMANAYIRVDDVAQAADAVAKLRAIATRTGERRALALVAAMDESIAQLRKYLALGTASVADRLARIDLLREIGRTPEARDLAGKLEKELPNDARVRVRVAIMMFETVVQSGDMIGGSRLVYERLDDPKLVEKDGDYWSLLIGANGVRAMYEVLPELARNPESGAAKMVEILKTIRKLSDELAKTKPGRAAALSFMLDLSIPLVDKMRKKDVAALMGVLRAHFAEAVALRAKYPEIVELDRIVETLAMWMPDRAAALAAVAQRPKTPPTEDAEIYVQRAHTGITLAMGMQTLAAVETARSFVDDIPPSWDARVEAQREAMLGDCDALTAAIGKDRAAWQRAEQHYKTARATNREVRARVTNNLGWIAQQQGDIALAEKLFRESADEDSSRRWLPIVSAASSPARASERLDAIRGLIQAVKGDGHAPVILNVWLASLSPDATEAGTAAKEALEDMDDALYVGKPSANGVGFESEGFFQVGLGIATRRLHELASTAYSNLWLMPPLPLDRAGLQAKVTAMPKPPKAKKS